MPEADYNFVDFSEWTSRPRDYKGKEVVTEATLIDWKYTADKDPLTVLICGMIAFSRGSELRLMLWNRGDERDIYYRQEIFRLFSSRRKEREEQFRELLDPLKGAVIRPVVMWLPAYFGDGYFHLRGLDLDGRILKLNEWP